VSNGAAVPRPNYNSGGSTNRVNGRITLGDIGLANVAKGALSFWVINLFNHVDRGFGFAAGNALNATTPPPQSPILLQPPVHLVLNLV